MNFSDSDERITEEGTPAAGSREFMTKVVCECNGKGDDMRLRNIPRAEGVLQAHPIVIKEENNQKGKWNQIFGNDHPIYIEIGMGKGQFLMTLAKQNPDINYIGIERYSSVLLRAVEKYEEFCGRDIVPGKEGMELPELIVDPELPNIRFVCMDAGLITDAFAPGEVARIYLNFSDPWPKKRHARRRLTSKEFLKRYDQILAKDGRVEFKTDNRDLFAFSLEEVTEAGWTLEASTWDLHHDETMNQGNVMTEYEAKFSSMGNPIHKLIAGR